MLSVVTPAPSALCCQQTLVHGLWSSSLALPAPALSRATLHLNIRAPSSATTRLVSENVRFVSADVRQRTLRCPPLARAHALELSICGPRSTANVFETDTNGHQSSDMASCCVTCRAAGAARPYA